jgi:hypothetical protein
MYYPRVSSFAIEQICSSKIKNWGVLPVKVMFRFEKATAALWGFWGFWGRWV